MNPEHASVIFDFLIPQVDQEVQVTRRVIAAVPQDKCSFRPSEKCKSAQELARHIAFSDIWFLESIANGGFEQPKDSGRNDESIAEILAIYDAQMPALIERLKKLSPEQLATPVSFFAFNFPSVTYLQFMLKHSAHHRGQLSSYLRPMGAKVPSIYGGSADEPLTAPAEATA